MSPLNVDPALRDFLTDEVLPGTGVGPDRFFAGLADAVATFGPRNEALLRERVRLQAAIDEWHAFTGRRAGPAEYQEFLEAIGYIVPPVAPFRISTADIDEEIASVSGPQLVVPVTNARYVLNAANARWGSLYDALYGTDALGDLPSGGPYDPARGARVVAWVRAFLDDVVPLASGSHADAVRYAVDHGVLVVTLASGDVTTLRDPSVSAGHSGDPAQPRGVQLRHHGLGIELRIDRDHPVGAADAADVADVLVESAVTSIVDFEDSVACVDAADKVGAYRNWLQLMTGELNAVVEKGGSSFVRRLEVDRSRRSLLLARIVGHLMTTDAVLDAAGAPVPEGILDTFVVAAIALHDRRRPPEQRNSRHGSVYLVKPKLHGPDEVAFTCEVFAAAERTLGLPERTLKLGIMDEERRTSVNLERCIHEAADRVVFVNTGFLDRTGDEIHTSMHAGPVLRKGEMRTTAWIRAYEDRNVDIALRCGFAGRAQIGKGMWAAPDRMADMIDQKLAPPAGRRQLRVGAVTHGRHVARDPLPPHRRRRAASRAGQRR